MTTAGENLTSKARMELEAAEAPQRVQEQFDRSAGLYDSLAQTLRRTPPRAVVTCARGSSDNAATFLRYLVETELGLLTASISPSVSSVYGVQQDLTGCLFVAISQSGSSPDLLATARSARASGAIVLALVNAPDSPLAAVADHAIPLCAGPESSVAATKSYLCALAAALQLVSHWSGNQHLLRATSRVPEELAAAWQLNWSSLIELLVKAEHAFVLGRGLGLCTAQEVALKLKETCALHAEGLSGAEVSHGPITLVGERMPVLLLCQDDATLMGMESLARELILTGVPVRVAGGHTTDSQHRLPVVQSHPAVAPLLTAQTFYRAAVLLAAARGVDPDRPPRLRKVTRTL
jgi:glucosamine--fructose-6-phosphate aminotransferase (isomerizing)